jgi:hypothetical protein
MYAVSALAALGVRVELMNAQINRLEIRLLEQEKRLYILVGLAAGGGAGVATVVGKLFGL